MSQSEDGEIIAHLLRAWGYQTLRGSSTRGSLAAIRAMKRFLQEPGALLAITMDGPTGPAHVAKPGSLAMAAKNGALLIPCSGAASRHWTFEKSWDRFQLPKPFGRIVISFGEPLEVARETDPREIAQLMATRVSALEAETDALVR